MASVVNINTPKGVIAVKIAGDSPTQEEMERVRGAFPSDDPEFSYQVSALEEETEKDPEEVIEGEVIDKTFRYEYGSADTEEEKSDFLTRVLGPGTFERVAEKTFIIDQEKVDPRVRDKYGLEDTGKIYADKPGFSKYDLVDFTGEAGTPLAFAMGASIAAAGLTMWPAAIIVGAAAGVGKAIDEGIEYLRGTQRQTPGEVGASVAMEAALAGVGGEVVGRGATMLIGRAWKGAGPAVSSERIAELQARGLSPEKAFKAARAEQSARFSEMVKAGARPGIKEAAGKAIAARVLGVNEAILPNPKIARLNTEFVRKTVDDLNAGKISETTAREALEKETNAIVEQINLQMADPDAAYKAVQRHLDEVVEVELKAFSDAYVPSSQIGMPEQYKDAAKLAARLFQADSQAMYQSAEKLIGRKISQFSTSGIKNTLKTAEADQKFIDFKSPLFGKIRESSKMSLSDLTQLKSALRIAMKDIELVPRAEQAALQKLITSVDDTLTNEFQELTLAMKMGGRQFHRKDGTFGPWTPIGPAEKENIKQGLAQWAKANEFYTEGQDQFNNAAVNMIVKNMKDKLFETNESLLDIFVKQGKSDQLKMYLDAVTPNALRIAKITKPEVRSAIVQAKKLVKNDFFVEANDLLGATGLVGVVPKIIPWIKTLPEDDVFRSMQKTQYMKQLDDLIQLSTAGVEPSRLRHAFRNSLAREWIDITKLQSQNEGRFAPGKFADHWYSLGDEVQDVLFGQEQAAALRKVIRNFSLVNKNQASLLDELTKIGDTNLPLKAQLQGLKDVVDTSIEESKSSLLTSIRRGEITTPENLVSGVLDDPNAYKRLASVVGETELKKVGGVKDQVMKNLIHNSFDLPINEANVQSGKWGSALLKSIENQNSNNALNTILGRDVVKSLEVLGKNAADISDASLRGLGGLAAPTEAIAIATALTSGLIYGNIASLGTAIGGLATITVLSRALRNPFVLKLITSPRIRADEYRKAIAAGADLPTEAAMRKGAEWSYAINQIMPIINSEMALVAGSGILKMPVEEEQVRLTEERRLAPQGRATPQVDPNIRRLSPAYAREEILGRATGVPNVPGAGEVLRRIEEEKLLGVRQ